MGRYNKIISEIKYHAGWFLIASAIFAPVVREWDIFAKMLPSVFYDYFSFVMTYSDYVMSVGVIFVMWKWIKDWKILMLLGSFVFFAIRYYLGG